MNKVAIIIIIVVLGGGAVYLYSAYSSLEISLDDVRVESIGLTSATLIFDLRIYNPSPIPLTVSSTRFDIYLEDQYIGTGTSVATPISANSQGTIQTPISFSYVDLGLGIVNILTNGGSAEVTVSGEAKVYVISMPFQVSETISFV